MGIFGNSWFAEGETPQGPLPYQEGLGGLLARIGEQATQPAPPGAWDDPAVQEKLQQWVEGMGIPGGLMTKFVKMGAQRALAPEEWQPLMDSWMRIYKDPRDIWKAMRHKNTDYAVAASRRPGVGSQGRDKAYPMYKSQETFDTGAGIARQAADYAKSVGRRDIVAEIERWLAAKARENRFAVPRRP